MQNPKTDASGVIKRVLNLRTRVFLWLAMTLLFGVALTVAGMTVYQQSMYAWVEHSHAVFQTTRSALLEIATAEREYLDGISGGHLPAPPPVELGVAVTARLDSVVSLTADNPAQHAAASDLRFAATRWWNAVVTPGGARSAELPGLSAAIDSVATKMLGEETRLYDLRLANFERAQSATVALVIVESIFVAFVLLEYSRRIGRHVASLTIQQTQLEEQASELEVTNQELAEAAEIREEALHRAEELALERTRSAALIDAWLDSAPMAVAVLNRELRFVRVNQYWADLTGRAIADHVNCAVLDAAFSPDATADIVPILQRTLDDATVATDREVHGHSVRDAQTHDWLLSCAPVAVDGFGVTGVAVTLHDVTDRTRLGEQLLHIQKMEAVGRLAGGIAHDFNNSLAIINAYASMAQGSGELSEANHERMHEINDAVERAASLTRQLLAFGRRQITRPQAVDTNEVIRHMMPMLVRILPESIVLETRLDAVPAIVSIDPSQLEQVMMNLVTNAAHAMPGGGSMTVETDVVELDEVYASTHADVVPGPFVALTLTDSGTGMDEATRNRIFEPFFTTKDAAQGSGLGLTSVYAIVKNANGHIWCYSEPGKGTSFKIYLPQASEPALPAVSATLPENAAHDATILVVEDDAKLRTVVARLLEQAGYTVMQAGNGPAALSILETSATDVDLVLTDLVMPEMSGRELSEAIAKRFPRLPILFTSGYTDDVVVQRGMVDRGFPFVQKPYTREALLAAIDQALSADGGPDVGDLPTAT